MRRGVCFPQWLLLLVAVLGISSGCQGLQDLERFANRHHAALNQALGLELSRLPTDSTVRYLFLQVGVAEICRQLKGWISWCAYPLGCRRAVGNTLRDSIVATGGRWRWRGLWPPDGCINIAPGAPPLQVSQWSIAQATYDTRENHERAVLRELLSTMDLEGVLIQADALHTQKPFCGSSRSRGPTSS